MKKNKIIKRLILLTALSGLGLNSVQVLAHGYVKSPESRGYKGQLAKSIIGWEAAHAKYGNVIDNPQSLEAKKGFPKDGPKDGRIASAEGGYGQIGDFILDDVGINRWDKNNIKIGDNIFTWTYTAPHSTAKWHYYMTKNGWNPEVPLNRASLELIGTVAHDGSTSTNNLSHKITIPSDRVGYHTILAVWDVSNTSNAFYSVIDVNVDNTELPEIDTENPSIPTNLELVDINPYAVKFKWTASTDNVNVKEYIIYRNNQKIATTASTDYLDETVTANKIYQYTVQAVDMSGNTSLMSEKLMVTTPELPEIDTEAPTQPSGLHAMEITSTTAEIMWTASTDNLKVSGYNIYRNGTKIGQTKNTSYIDKKLVPETAYTYQVTAFDKATNESIKSNLLELTTKPEDIENNGSWSATKTYNNGDIVTYKNGEFRCKWWTKGNNPEASEAWLLIKGQQNWNTKKAYGYGDKVIYNGKNYQAKQWNTNKNPTDNSKIWALIN